MKIVGCANKQPPSADSYGISHAGTRIAFYSKCINDCIYTSAERASSEDTEYTCKNMHKYRKNIRKTKENR